MTNWLTGIITRNTSMDEKSVILGNRNNDLICNYVTIITKHEIYKAKWNKTRVTLAQVKKILKYLMETDIYIYISNVNHTMPKTLGIWSSLYNVLRNLCHSLKNDVLSIGSKNPDIHIPPLYIYM